MQATGTIMGARAQLFGRLHEGTVKNNRLPHVWELALLPSGGSCFDVQPAEDHHIPNRSEDLRGADTFGESRVRTLAPSASVHSLSTGLFFESDPPTKVTCWSGIRAALERIYA